MANTSYLTAPIKTTGMPPGVSYIIGNEAAERFSFYGMNSILVVFMTKYMLDASGKPDLLTEAQAETWYHTFFTWVYLLPILGAVLADAVWGKYRTIFWVSIIYCLGHFALAFDHTRSGLLVGMALIAIGAGGIKPCVSANVGDQFGPSNQHLLSRVFSWFYFSINLGSAVSTMLIPYLLDRVGPATAFGIPGVFMLIAAVIFWMGRRKFVHIPPAGLANYFGQFRNLETLKTIGNLLIPVPFVAVFWGLWYQNFSSWVLQADKMDRHLFGHEWLPAQIQTVNPVFILIMLPLFSYVVYPAIDRVFRLNALRKIGIGLFVTAISFAIVAWIQTQIDAGKRPHINWQILAFVVLTVSEVMVSVTHLEFSYTQAPTKMKSIVMCTYLGAISLGNFLTAQFNQYNQNADGSLKYAGAAYFWFFVVVMVITSILFVPVARLYRGRTHIQEEAAAAGS